MIPKESAGILNEKFDRVPSYFKNPIDLTNYNKTAVDIYNQYMQNVSINVKKQKLQSQQESYALGKKIKVMEAAVTQQSNEFGHDQSINAIGIEVKKDIATVTTYTAPVVGNITADVAPLVQARKKLVVKMKSTSSSSSQ